MLTVTLDTNIVPGNQITTAVPASQFDFAVVSITEREPSGAGVRAAVVPMGRLTETWVMGESILGQAILGSASDSVCFEQVLAIISNNSFPKPELRKNLSEGQRHQLRDAMIFCAHARAGRDVFVTNDARGLIRDGRRAELEARFNTKIMTAAEFMHAFDRGAP